MRPNASFSHSPLPSLAPPRPASLGGPVVRHQEANPRLPESCQKAIESVSAGSPNLDPAVMKSIGDILATVTRDESGSRPRATRLVAPGGHVRYHVFPRTDSDLSDTRIGRRPLHHISATELEKKISDYFSSVESHISASGEIIASPLSQAQCPGSAIEDGLTAVASKLESLVTAFSMVCEALPTSATDGATTKPASRGATAKPTGGSVAPATTKPPAGTATTTGPASANPTTSTKNGAPRETGIIAGVVAAVGLLGVS